MPVFRIVCFFAFAVSPYLAFSNAAPINSPRQESNTSVQPKSQADPATSHAKEERLKDSAIPHSDVQILSDTMGIDFGPYLQRVVSQVRERWYSVIPESAKGPMFKRGEVIVDFAILKNGGVAGLRIQKSSGDDSLDRSAFGAVTKANPLPPLPDNFSRPFLQLRFRFQYNPEKKPTGAAPVDYSGASISDIKILSDTMGTDFGPYTKRLVYAIREHWHDLIPEWLMKRSGDVVIGFTILKDGKIADLRLLVSAGNDALDRAAWAAVSTADGLPLPADFSGTHLEMALRFQYNPETRSAEPTQPK